MQSDTPWLLQLDWQLQRLCREGCRTPERPVDISALSGGENPGEGADLSKVLATDAGIEHVPELDERLIKELAEWL